MAGVPPPLCVKFASIGNDVTPAGITNARLHHGRGYVVVILNLCPNVSSEKANKERSDRNA